MYISHIKQHFTCILCAHLFEHYLFTSHFVLHRDASMMSMRRKIAGLTPDEIRALPKEELDLPVTQGDFHAAVSKCNKSVSQQDLDKYETWMREFGST